ncbi:MAG: DUF4830 domain-containing protein [Oscillospiraceae bacterium]|nr:DUF4830 domain-containing protein [Oscillospiraceae bacterium]
MIIFTTKLNRKKYVLAFFVVAVLVLGIILAVAKTGGGKDNVGGKHISTNEDRISYLESYGWVVSDQPIASEELVIPNSLEKTYSQYNTLQTEQGFNLARFQGKKAMRYTYKILNYPTGETDVQANLLMYKSTVIGGDVCTTALDGWMHGLAYPGS